MVDEFKKALESGWRPKVENDPEFKIRNDARITWFPTFEMSIVPSSAGPISLDKSDLEDARQYNLRRKDAKEEER